ncbi:zinc-ribbon domain-containing protein [Ottowia sp.]|uniref:zinc-ribbon domain-containing protein n=1 Tax=Ottowia sp. TaxID=1898956 RepID=UPI003A86716E
MKSNKARRAEIKARRLERAQRMQERWAPDSDVRFGDALQGEATRAGLSVVAANQAALRLHNSEFDALPAAYVDKAFVCRQCGAQALWTAKQQRWWYEVAGGSVYSTAMECRACRRARKDASQKQWLSVQTDRLHALARLMPDAGLRVELDAALDSKWQGIRVTAVGVVGQWWGAHRDPQDLARLKRWVEDAGGNYNQWPRSAAKAAAKGIALNLRDADLGWVLDWFLSSGECAVDSLIVRQLPQEMLLQAMNAPGLRRAAHTDVPQATTLLKILSAADFGSPSWPSLAQHYMASLVIGELAAKTLQWQWRWVQDRARKERTA